MYKVSSEIYKETNFKPTKGPDGKVVSKFIFRYPSNVTENVSISTDKDGDLVLKRKRQTDVEVEDAEIEIEHSEATELRLVGLQVWRGALLLADYIFHKQREFAEKQILELGAGVGLTSIAAAIYARKVICTDVDIGGILELIRANVQRNNRLLRANVEVLEYNFMRKQQDHSPALLQAIDDSDVVMAADVIYDDNLTDAFIAVIDDIFQRASRVGKPKTIYLALEKRFVFTLAELDTVAPMFDYFLKQTMTKTWHFEYIPIDFPQYFQYERSKHLLLIKITSC